MQKLRNPLDDCLRILACFGSLAGIYVIYRLLELAGSTITAQDIRLLLILSITTLFLAVAIIFAYFVLFISERLLLVLGQFRKMKSSDKLIPEIERLNHLELTVISAFERMENRLAFLENRIGEESIFPVGYEANSREGGFQE